MRLSIQTQPLPHNFTTRRRRGGSYTTSPNELSEPFYTEFFSTNDNTFYPLYLIHSLYARTSEEIVYRVPWVNGMPRTGGRWSDVGESLQKSTIMRSVYINNRRVNLAVCKGFACEVSDEGLIKPLMVVSTPYVEELFNVGKKKSINQKYFYILQSKDFLDNAVYKNLRSQLRKVYVNPLISSGMNTIICHDINELVFNPVKLQMKFGSTEDMDKELEILKKSVCPAEPPLKPSSIAEPSRVDMMKDFNTSMWEEITAMRTESSVQTGTATIFGTGGDMRPEGPQIYTRTGSTSASPSDGSNIPDGTIEYDEDGRMRVWSSGTREWITIASIDNTVIHTQRVSPIPDLSELENSISTPEPSIMSTDEENAFIDRIMQEEGENDELPF